MTWPMTPQELDDMAWEAAARFEAEGDPRDLTIYKLATRYRVAMTLTEWARQDARNARGEDT